ncbi:MAG: alpha/beta hydrolase [Bacteroidota bacterium]
MKYLSYRIIFSCLPIFIICCQKHVADSSVSKDLLTTGSFFYEDISYAADTLFRHKMDIHVPGGLSELAPLVVYIHGGGFRAGKKGGNGVRYCDTLLAQGYVIADINYRLSQDSIFPAQVYDCKTAIRYLKLNAEKYAIDTTRIGVMGHSAGGHLSAFLGTSIGIDSLEGYHLGNRGTNSSIHAVIDFFGPTDFLQMDATVPLTPPDSCKKFMIHDEPNSPESELLGCLISACPERVKQANPITYVNGNEPSFAIYHGAFDCLVSPHQSTLLFNKLEAVGVDIEFEIYPHVKHADKFFITPKMKGKVSDFFNRQFNK